VNQRNADDPLIWVYCGHCWTSFRRQHGRRQLLRRQWRQTSVCCGRRNDDLLGGRRMTSACERRPLSLRSRLCARALLRCPGGAAFSVAVPFSPTCVVEERRGAANRCDEKLATWSLPGKTVLAQGHEKSSPTVKRDGDGDRHCEPAADRQSRQFPDFRRRSVPDFEYMHRTAMT